MFLLNNNIVITYKQQRTNSDSLTSIYPYYHLLNRLDYDVSGLLIYICIYIVNIFLFNKTYYALVYGFLPISIKIPLICNYRYSLSKVFLIYYISYLDISIIRIEIITGRKNQIRRQLSYIGHPVILDRRFGNYLLDRFTKTTLKLQGIQLFSYSLSILYENNCIPCVSLKWLHLKKGKHYLEKIKH
ncbi:hypothetical protein [Candidatus Vidania fulgoroideorum]